MGARAAATAIVSAATSSGLSVVADVSPNTARLLGDSQWEFLRSIGVARVRIGFGFSVLQILSINAGVYDVCVGDPVLIDHSWSLFGAFVRDDVVMLDDSWVPRVNPVVIETLAIPDRNRPDAAEAMVRLEHWRNRFARLALPVVGGQPKLAGSVTAQLPSAGTCCAEGPIMLRDMPSDDRRAVLSRIASPSSTSASINPGSGAGRF